MSSDGPILHRTRYNVIEKHDPDTNFHRAGEFSLGVTPDLNVVYQMTMPCGCCIVYFECPLDQAEDMARQQLEAIAYARRTGVGLYPSSHEPGNA